jgi:hypothetical protein
MKAYRGVDVQIHIFLISALAEGEWSALRPCRFTPGERTLGGPQRRSARRGEKKFLILPGHELRPLGHPDAIRTMLSRLSLCIIWYVYCKLSDIPFMHICINNNFIYIFIFVWNDT